MNETKFRNPQRRLDRRIRSSEPEAGKKVAAAEVGPNGIILHGDDVEIFMTLDEVRRNFGETHPQVVADVINKAFEYEDKLRRQAYLTTPRRD